MQIKEVEHFEYFSSDFNCKKLISSDKEGNIRLDNGRIIESDSVKKYVKFYLPDDYVFTTTSLNGLSVWDTEKEKCIYSYKQEHLYDHCYSPNCILGSFDTYNLKFYDLRSRYMINSKTHSNIEKIQWCDDYIYVLSENVITVYDYRTLNTLYSFKNATDFCVVDKKLHYISHEANKSFLSCASSLNDTTIESMKKETTYYKIQSIENGKLLIGLTANGYRIEKDDEIEIISLGKIKPESIHFTEDIGYVFSKSCLYKIEGNLL